MSPGNRRGAGKFAGSNMGSWPPTEVGGTKVFPLVVVEAGNTEAAEGAGATVGAGATGAWIAVSVGVACDAGNASTPDVTFATV